MAVGTVFCVSLEIIKFGYRRGRGAMHNTHIYARARRHTHTHTHTHTLSLSLSLSHRHTHTQTHTCTLTHSLTHSHTHTHTDTKIKQVPVGFLQFCQQLLLLITEVVNVRTPRAPLPHLLLAPAVTDVHDLLDYHLAGAAPLETVSRACTVTLTLTHTLHSHRLPSRSPNLQQTQQNIACENVQVWFLLHFVFSD